jgi:hypothetical protein
MLQYSVVSIRELNARAHVIFLVCVFAVTRVYVRYYVV